MGITQTSLRCHHSGPRPSPRPSLGPHSQPRSQHIKMSQKKTKTKSSLMQRLNAGEVILGDGSYIYTLERRGYATAGMWTPEAAAEEPRAVEQLAIEFARAGADITQTFSFWCHEDKLPKGCQFSVDQINQAACDIACTVAKDKGTIVASGITQTGLFQGEGPKPTKQEVQAEIRNALEIYKKNDVDLILCEYFRNVIEIEWAIEVALEFNLPVAATMCMGPCGDEDGVSVGECAVRMARAGADIVGTNCLFDPFATFAVEPRQITRWEARKWAREAYNIGVRIIGGCCGFEPYHVRAMAEELRDVRGKLPDASAKSDYDLAIHKALGKEMPRYKAKGEISYWMNQHPSTGRPLSTAMSRQDETVMIHKSILL